MDRTFLDTSFILGFANRNDDHHDEARSKMAEIKEGRMFISDQVFTESVQTTQSRQNQEKARELAKYLTRSEIELVHLNEPGFQKARDLFQSKSAEFVDCSIVSTMKILGIERLATFNTDFENFHGVKLI